MKKCANIRNSNSTSLKKKNKNWTFNSQKDRRLENLDGTSIWRTYHNDVLGITNAEFFAPVIANYMEKN